MVSSLLDGPLEVEGILLAFEVRGVRLGYRQIPTGRQCPLPCIIVREKAEFSLGHQASQR